MRIKKIIKSFMSVSDINHGSKRLFYQKLSAIRGIAAVIIILYHSLAHSRTWQVVEFNTLDQVLRSLGLVIVFFFLILSGFINFRPYASSILTGESPVVKGAGFFVRRISKLLPIYWVALTLWLIVAHFLNLENFGWKMYFFGHIFLAENNTQFITGIITSWALAIEFFYLLPLTIISFYLGLKRVKLKNKTLLLYSILAFITIIISNVIRYSDIKIDPSTFKQWLPIQQWDKFVLGELMALLIVFVLLRGRNQEGLKKYVRLLRVILPLLGIILLYQFPIDDWFFTKKDANYIFFSNFTPLPLAIWLMIEGIFFTKGRWFKVKILQRLGELSYPLFIFHPVSLDFIRLYYQLELPYFRVFNNWGVNFIFALITSILFSLLIERIIVNPINKIIKKYDSSAKE